MSIYLYGCGGHAKVIADILRCRNQPVAGFVDDDPAKTVSHIRNVPILSSAQLDNISPTKSRWIVSIGDNATRQLIAQKLANRGYVFTTAVHPSAQVAEGVAIGAGTVVMANAVVNVDTVIGKHAIINTGAVVDHDCQISDYAHVAPNCGLCGGVQIGTGALLGVGTQAIPGRRVGAWAVCGAGSVLVADVPADCLAYGVPTSPKKYFQDLSQGA